METPGLLQLAVDRDVVIARLLGGRLLDSAVVQEMTGELMAAIAAHKPTKLLISFARVMRCSTEVINSLLLAKKHLLGEGGDVKLCEMSDSIRHTYRILNLEGTVFEIFETEEDALHAF
jgi:anti-anti-sigma regulatory factor